MLVFSDGLEFCAGIKSSPFRLKLVTCMDSISRTFAPSLVCRLHPVAPAFPYDIELQYGVGDCDRVEGGEDDDR